MAPQTRPPDPSSTRAPGAVVAVEDLVSTIRVLKFGGSSLATPDRVANVAQIVMDAANGVPAVVVVSAFQGVTNDLLECARLAERISPASERAYEALCERHRAAIDHLFEPGPAGRARAHVNKLLEELGDALRGIALLRSCPPSALDLVASFGERLSALIMAEHVNQFRPAWFVDAREFIITDDQFTHARVQHARTARAIRRHFALLWGGADHPIPIVTGFIGSTADGRTTTVGRNGSDYTASLVGAALQASAIEIWTDVDGVFSADPKAVAEPVVLPQLTYEQAQNLSYFGAKVLHPASIAPAVAEQIPILIKNTFRPHAPGTLIRREAKGIGTSAGVTSIADVTLLTIKGSKTAARVSERVFRALADHAVDVLLSSQASSEQTLSLAVPTGSASVAVKAIAREFRLERRQRSVTLERRPNQSLLALVGLDKECCRPEASQVLTALGRHGIHVTALAEGTGSRTAAYVVDAAERPRALHIIHRRLFDQRIALGLAVVGVGNVGGALLRQLAARGNDLAARGFAVKIVAVANSRQCVVNAAGVDPTNWRPELECSQQPTDIRHLAAALKTLDLPACAVIDCTASDAVVDRYPDLLDAGCHLITANKRPLVLPWTRYAALTNAFARRQRHLLYEGTVGAALPVISTLRDLVQTGDTIFKIEGMFSGTLSYLFNGYDGRVPFSELVRDAHARGFTEPDPREDLSGTDVARKLLILARETGASLELEDVQVEGLLPPPLRSGPFSDALFTSLAEQDVAMASRFAAAHARGCVLRYVGTVDAHGARACLQEVPVTHPLASTRSTDNSIAFTTARYSETPLVVQGPGAGADVTAMAVFSDILELLRYLPQ